MNKFILLLAAFGLSIAATHASGVKPVDLRCDYAANPLGVDSAQPRLFWKLESSERNQKQTAYEILVASSPQQLAKNTGDLWDSGKVASDETIQIPYAGAKLKSFEQVFWKVRVWDGAGKLSESQLATWTMGVLQPSDWHAKWIGAADKTIPSLRLRHNFSVKPGLKRALVNICGLGQYELSINGQKIGDDYLSPGWTEYNKTCLYDTRDITENLKHGDNAVGIELGNGMYNVLGGGRFTKFKRSFGPQQAIAQIRLEYADGSVDFVATDGSWRVAPGPITFSSIYGGEDYDARLEQPGWNKTGFKDKSTWPPAEVLDGPGGELRGLSCAAPPLKLFETHKAIASHTLTNGDVVYDLGQNASHVWEITVSGPKGSKVSLMPSELLARDGSVDQGSMGAGRRGPYLSEFTKGSDGTEIWSPKFYFVGCRYYQIHLTAPSPGSATLSPSDGERGGVRGSQPKIKSVAGRVMHSSSAPVGDFECSNELFNRIRTLVRWAQRNNMFSILTDCPHREKLGWLEQTHLNGPSIRYEFALDQLFTKVLNDIADSQLPNGVVPTTAPEYAIFADKNSTLPRNNFGDSPEWSAAIYLVPWQQYEFSGDLELFRRHYDSIKRYIDYLGTRSTNYILTFGLGDWYDIGPRASGISQLTPIGLTATAFYFESADIMSRVAGMLGKVDDAKNYAELAGKIRATFNNTFYDSTNHTYGTGSQCANAIPLVMGLCEPTNRAAVLDALVSDIRAHDNANTAGDVGYRYVLRALADNGRSDVIFEINNQTNKPGYGMQLAKGKTSLTEGWDGGHSQDHFMLGQIEEWFYHDLAGIQNASDSAGFKHIVIAPQPVGNITWVKASYNSIRGKIVSDWKRDDNGFALHVSIPPNTSATVCVPGAGGVVKGPSDAKLIRLANGRAIYAIGSGEYHFVRPNPPLNGGTP